MEPERPVDAVSDGVPGAIDVDEEVADVNTSSQAEEHAEVQPPEQAEEAPVAKTEWKAPKIKIYERMHAAEVKVPWENSGKDDQLLFKWHALEQFEFDLTEEHEYSKRCACDSDQCVKDALDGKSGMLECLMLQHYGGEKRGQVAKGGDGIKMLGGTIPEVRQGQIASLPGDNANLEDKFTLGIVDKLFVQFSMDGDKELPLVFYAGVYSPYRQYLVLVRVRTHTQDDRSQH